MKLSLKKSFNNWVEVGENEDGSKVKFLLDYPTREQEQHLQTILFGGNYKDNDLGLKYSQQYLKYVIKDWENVFDQDNQLVKCEVINGELEESIWWALVRDGVMALNLFVACQKELSFTANDKKK